ncbi:MAG: sulfatase [Planctomycetota bacterium]
MRQLLKLALIAQAVFFAAAVDGRAQRTNVLLICIDDLRPELACFGASYIVSPNIDRLASEGRAFHRHYVQAPTCGASRYALLTGRYGGSTNQALFQRAAAIAKEPSRVPPSMPAWFRRHGYTTVSVGKVSHHPGGRGGERWDDGSVQEMPDSWDRHRQPVGAWRDPRGWMHGLAHGEIRIDAAKLEMDVMQAVDGPDSIYPDGISVDDALAQLDSLAADKAAPFFLAVGILRPHLPFGAPAKYLKLYEPASLPPIAHASKPAGRTTWHKSGEFMKYDRGGRDPNTDPDFALLVRKHYAACVSYADAQVGRLLSRLRERGEDGNTVVVLWGDHGWHLGEHAIWGKHSLFEESLRSPLIVAGPGIAQKGAPTDAIVESIDVFPTLCDLAGVPTPRFVHGGSLRPLLEDPASEGHAAVSYTRKAKTLRTPSHRLVVHDDGFCELYDHQAPEAETVNTAAASPLVVQELRRQLQAKLAR